MPDRVVGGEGHWVEYVRADDFRGAVAANARIRAVMAEAVDEIQNRRVEDAIQMLLNALDALGGQ